MIEWTVAVFNMSLAIMWALIGGLSFAIAAGLALRIFAYISDIDLAEGLEKGNMAISLVQFGIIIGLAVIVATALP